MTGEHIWPHWLNPLLPKTRYRNERVDDTVKSNWSTKELKQTANVVCKTCNEGWMSELEGRAKGLLADVIVSGRLTTFSHEDQRLLAAYAFQKSVIANYQTLGILPEPISTWAQRERFRLTLAVPPEVRIWISSFQGRARYSGRSNPRYARSDTDPAPLNDLDIYTHTYVVGHLVFQVLACRFRDLFNRGVRVELPKQSAFWEPACQQIWPIETEIITWPLQYLGSDTIEHFVERWFGKIQVTLH